MTDIMNLLPIGSVIRLRGAKKNLMIFGVKQTNVDNQEEYDYIGVLWPEGNMGTQTQILFHHKDIERVLFTGWDTDERKVFMERLSTFYDKQN